MPIHIGQGYHSVNVSPGYIEQEAQYTRPEHDVWCANRTEHTRQQVLDKRVEFYELRSVLGTV